MFAGLCFWLWTSFNIKWSWMGLWALSCGFADKQSLVPNWLDLGAFKNSLFKTCLAVFGWTWAIAIGLAKVLQAAWPPWHGKSFPLLAALRVCRCVPQSALSASWWSTLGKWPFSPRSAHRHVEGEWEPRNPGCGLLWECALVQRQIPR